MSALIRFIKARSAVWKIPLILVVSLLIIGWLIETPRGLLGKADAIAYAVCHRIDGRSFHLGEHQLPLCARCTGMYLGALLGLLYQHRISRRKTGIPPWRVISVLGIFVVAFFVDGLNSYLTLFPGAPHVYEPNNMLRLLTGTGMGLAMAAALYPAFNQTVWKEYSEEHALPGLIHLLKLILLALLVDFMVLDGNPLLVYPLALISSAGVLILLSMIYCMVWLIIFKSENRYEINIQVLFPLFAGFSLAFIQIVLLDVGRYIVTGTWNGFNLG